jgi:hypothetical protein
MTLQSNIDALKQYLPLCWFKNNPLNLPKSMAFFNQNLVFYFIVEFFLQTNMVDDPIESFFEVSLETSLTLLFAGFMMLFNKSLYVYIQVATAILFCENVVSIISVPVIVWLTVSESALSYYIFGMLVLWDFSLIAYIFKRVLAINLVASLALSLFYFIATYGAAFSLAQVI